MTEAVLELDHKPEAAAEAKPTVPPELLTELRLANDDLHKKQLAYDSAAEVAKAKKKDMEAAQQRLNSVCDRITDSNLPLPLFDAGEDAWRAVRLDTLSPTIANRYIGAMAQNDPPIETLGELTDWQNAKGDFWAKDIDGLGDTGRAEVEAATEAYWLANPPDDSEDDDAEQ